MSPHGSQPAVVLVLATVWNNWGGLWARIISIFFDGWLACWLLWWGWHLD